MVLGFVLLYLLNIFVWVLVCLRGFDVLCLGYCWVGFMVGGLG